MYVCNNKKITTIGTKNGPFKIITCMLFKTFSNSLSKSEKCTMIIKFNLTLSDFYRKLGSSKALIPNLVPGPKEVQNIYSTREIERSKNTCCIKNQQVYIKGEEIRGIFPKTQFFQIKICHATLKLLQLDKMFSIAQKPSFHTVLESNSNVCS